MPSVDVNNTLSEPFAPEPLTHQPFGTYRLVKYWSRAAALIVIPPSIASYFICTWLFYIKDTSPVNWAPFDQTWMYYSWFLVGVFGLNISKYGLCGAEAAMLQTPMWQTRNAVELMMHSDAAWSGVGGWARWLRILIKERRVVTGRLWHLLSSLSVAAFLGFSLSGLTMELSDGYVPSSAVAVPIGRSWDTFNAREAYQTVQEGISAWRDGLPITPPGIGLIYLEPDKHRNHFSSLLSVPNEFPAQSNEVLDLFLPGQSESPVAGRAWGLRSLYGCRIVESVSELKILQLNGSAKAEQTVRSSDATQLLQLSTSSNAVIYAFNSSNYAGSTGNLWSYAEMGLSIDPNLAYDNEFLTNGNALDTGILEYVLWQVQTRVSVPGWSVNYTFITDAGQAIAGLGTPFVQDADGNFQANRTFFVGRGYHMQDIPGDLNIKSYANATKMNNSIISLAPPIGVQCGRRAFLGTAMLDVEKTSFSDFQLSAPPPAILWNQQGVPPPLFGGTAALILAGRYSELSTGFAINYAVPAVNVSEHAIYVSADRLLESVYRAHAVDALQLMYDRRGRIPPFTPYNLTATMKARVLQPGAIPAIIPAILLSIWAVGSVTLGLVYGFRRRWSETLDGYSLFRYGADLADEIRHQPGFSSTQPFYECKQLFKMPGSIGDGQSEFNVGYVGLVDQSAVLNPRKHYI